MTIAAERGRRDDRVVGWLQAQLPKLVLSPSILIITVFVYGFILWTIGLSFSKSRILPVYKFAGFEAYEKLWNLPNWYVALENLAIFGVLYIGLCVALGLFLSVLLDQRSEEHTS